MHRSLQILRRLAAEAERRADDSYRRETLMGITSDAVREVLWFVDEARFPEDFLARLRPSLDLALESTRRAAADTETRSRQASRAMSTILEEVDSYQVERGRWETAALLRAVPVLSELPEEALLTLAEGVEHWMLLEGDRMVAPGSRPKALHVIASGRVGVFSPEGILLRELGRGDCPHLLQDEPYPHLARALEDSEAISLPRAVVETLMDRYPQLQRLT
ncbi:MAG: Crp/Fnr family transcriptional regulator [Candidatus Eremiobacterota bacterium]